MATYEVTAPDGTVLEVTAPEGASMDEVIAYAQANWSPPSAPPAVDQSEAETKRLQGKQAPQEPSFLSKVGSQVLENFTPGLSSKTPEQVAQEADPYLRQLGLAGRIMAKSGMSGFGVGTAVVDPFLQMAGLPTASESIDKTITAVGLPEAQGAMEKGVQTAGEVVASIGGQAKAATMLPQAAALVPTLGQKVSSVLSDDIGQQLAAGVPAAVVGDFVANKAVEAGMSPVEAGGYALASGVLTGLITGKGYRTATQKKTPLFTPEMAKQQATEAYDKVAKMGVQVKPKPITDALDDIQKNLAQAEGGFYPNAIPEHTTVQRILDEYRTVAQTGPMSFQALDKLRSNLITMARETKDASTRRLLNQVTEGIDYRISTLQPSDLAGGKGALKDVLSTVRDAREAWRRGAKATILEDALGAAMRRGEAPTASVGELIRNNFKSIYADKKKMKLFTPDEQEAIRKVVAGKQSLENLLSFAARFNPQRSQLMAGGLAAGSVMNPAVGIPVGVGGFVADKSLAALQRQAAQQVMSQIASGKIPRPRSDANWRALVEAQMQAMQPATQGE